VHVDRKLLVGDQRVAEVDGRMDREDRRGCQTNFLVAIDDHGRLTDHRHLPGRLLLANADLIDEADEGRRRAVQDGNLGAAELYAIEADPGQNGDAAPQRVLAPSKQRLCRLQRASGPLRKPFQAVCDAQTLSWDRTPVTSLSWCLDTGWCGASDPGPPTGSAA